MLSAEEILERFEKIRQAPLEGGVRAPHKPLFLLYLLGRLQRTGSSKVTYTEIEPDVSRMINEFGPAARDRHRAAMPFFYLDRSLWRLEGEPSRAAHSVLRDREARGELQDDVERALLADPRLLADVARRLLAANFPETYVEGICQAAGLDLAREAEVAAPNARRRSRSSEFREAVLGAYQYACAMCGYDGALGRDPVGVDAAHVHWHALGGPDDLANGVALCNLHHTLFDRGVLGLDEERRVVVSPSFVARGDAGRTFVWALDGKPLLGPKPSSRPIAATHIDWHRKQVFRAA